MYRASKQFRFCAAHKLDSSYTVACQRVHGHNYEVEVVVQSDELNMDGMVIDFGKLKNIIKPLIDLFDHKMFIHGSPDEIRGQAEFPDVDNGVLFTNYNPTAENMAKDIFHAIDLECNNGVKGCQRELSEGGYHRKVFVYKVRVQETESSWAEYINGH